MIVNEIPIKVEIQVEDAESDTGMKNIQTTVLSMEPIATISEQGASFDVMVLFCLDKEGIIHGRPIDKVRVIETKKVYGASQVRGTRRTHKKKRAAIRKSDKIGNNNSGNNKGDKN